MSADFDAQVRAADPDRWLSSRFVNDPTKRADLMVLYALEAELLTIPTRVTQPLLAEMRYAWWSEQLEGVFSGDPRRGHPILEALADVAARRGLTRAPFDALIEAHIQRVHGAKHDLNAFYVGPMQAAAKLLGGAGLDLVVSEAAHVWGLGQVGRRDEARAVRPTANAALKLLPPDAFPAVAHAALTKRDEPEAFKRLRLIWAALTGRI
ncbi:squalene/phytoene synthase [Brevundimonas sp. Leaf363]|uniref:squalene/phytoene synthase family protein n=1 Tax=Brevundimonas sp. Leaf363 TaxID=1736353 RepID=UPI0006FE9645|nr:squalene/phytoene synthase family protein [Brevundimonas sp. Leaf363]KQS56443.1 squalene/phytoene synthase [Brevundimonas sp. Leaf363]